jgi:RHH-type transcriptional regulator, proline utilization regulon repressor / proline dehydrogenase / delta 1-pyrroline-5-carboxylate dehydrogenase
VSSNTLPLGSGVGNAYINRNMTGAVVGVQPFGGEGAFRHRTKGRRTALPDVLCTERT